MFCASTMHLVEAQPLFSSQVDAVVQKKLRNPVHKKLRHPFHNDLNQLAAPGWGTTTISIKVTA